MRSPGSTAVHKLNTLVASVYISGFTCVHGEGVFQNKGKVTCPGSKDARETKVQQIISTDDDNNAGYVIMHNTNFSCMRSELVIVRCLPALVYNRNWLHGWSCLCVCEVHYYTEPTVS